MQSGTEPPDYEEILPNPRWHRLCGGFREVGALLVLAVPASAPHIEDLVAAADGAVLVGDAAPPAIPVLARDRDGRASRGSMRRVLSRCRRSPAPSPGPAGPTPWWRRRTAAVAGVLLTIVLIAATRSVARLPAARENTAPARLVPEARHGAGARHGASRSTSDSRSVRLRRQRRSRRPPIPRVVNPTDSAAAAIFAVELMATNTQAGAILKLQKDGARICRRRRSRRS